MRGNDAQLSGALCLIDIETRVPQDHPLRRIKALADASLKELSPVFDRMYSKIGRPSIPPERLLKATLLMAFYTVRSERLLCEMLEYNLLFRWFLGMDMMEAPFDHSSFSRNRQRLLDHDVASQFFATVVAQAAEKGLMSDEHFTVDGTLIEAWASLKSFRKKGENRDEDPPPDDPGNPTVDFHGEKRSNATHESTTDPEAKLAKKSWGTAAKLSYCGNALMENRSGLLVDIRIDEANGTAERTGALAMIDDSIPGSHRVTVGADKGYDTNDFVAACRERKVTPHIARNTTRNGGSALDGRTIRHSGYQVSQRLRKRVEEIFGWMKTVGNFRKTRYKGKSRNQLAAYLVGAAYNLVRMSNLLPATA
jgi:transposase